MRIIGIDPGLKATGYGVVEVTGTGTVVPLEVGSIEPRAREVLPGKLFKIYKLLGEIIGRQHPDVMVLEKLYAHYKHPLTASIMGHARGVICLTCAERGLPLVEYSVKRVRKALVGNGNATKEQTRSIVANFLRLDPAKLSLDASDALALALGHASMARFSKR